ncbi:3-[(3aS,4S,7aS)-7a-methyl-1,5-dioxo-octahydro-1H-inden-4-yl]propanoyl:CoA ligase [Mycolicibacterium vanbaalenii]|uniref:3-[(3aS,4S,7aS)-7a-methyl-1,5-dioxo-octahydro-1H-inden-4-yl]propanoyl:CoA ligase n=1 Tax=Mycolicibacterium vanbaalenii TaxID=110539 RepID=A0A5S9NVG2_MYCVN|nr:class I adenylate-forming enzyme family protein [Mycolicibacterium vanbaalenii]CAA0094735.1 3-[(3aS,4S,7aS)-7a-methyl-1,5-dioxo-octahydro-1H-inden-4-yl]propanoyl:CoA ligase [Mycolicibacterium vanbaalenii]
MTDTVDSLLREHAVRHSDKPAIIDPDGRISYRDLDRGTRALAASFVEAGIGKGSRVGLIMANGVEWARIAVALLRIGAVLVPLSTLLSPRELTAQLRTASVQHLIAVEQFRGRRYLDTLQIAGLPALRSIRTPAQVDVLTADPDAVSIVDSQSRGVRPSDPLVVMFTSGSSGPPKGVRHSHRSAIGAVRAGLAARCIDADTRLYLPMPLFWVGGFGGGLLSTLVAGATLVTEPVPEPVSTLRLLEAERVTLFRGWPDQAAALARHLDEVGADLTALRPGSLEALLPAQLQSPPGARARLLGMTESFGPYCGFPADTDLPVAAWGSCGRPFDGMQVRIVDVETGDPVPAGTVGVIQIRGPHVLRGLCGRSREDVFTPDGYYPTGDLGRLDDAGFLFFQGRSDDMFKVSGATVYPSEVAQALCSLDGVTAAFVTNVPGPSGDRVGAAVVCGRATTAEALRTAATAVLSSFKVPTIWRVLDSDDEVPRGATGKVDVIGLRGMLADT